MKSIKRGRAGSITSGIIGLLFAGIMFLMARGVSGMFGVFGMSGLGAIPVAMGVIVLIASAMEIYNGTRKNRFSEYDIVEEGEEPDPLNEHFAAQDGEQDEVRPAAQSDKAAYCPYCGAAVRDDYAFCMACGKRLPGKGE